MDELYNYCAWSVLMRYEDDHRLDFVRMGSKYSAKDAGDLMKKLIVDFRV